MKGLREPLLWIALASFFACLPLPTVALPASAALVLATRLILALPVARSARTALLRAQIVFAPVSLAHALGLLGFDAADRVACVSAPLGLFSLAGALASICDTAVLDRCALWLRSLRPLLLLWFLCGCVLGLVVLPFGLAAWGYFAVIVLRMRADAIVPDAR